VRADPKGEAIPKYPGPWGVVAQGPGAVCAGKGVGEVQRCALEVAQCADLVEIYASVCGEVEQPPSDLCIIRRASILLGPGCNLFQKRTLTTSGGEKGFF